ncbi:MAG: efflux transporter outer membrane subunit [Phycisphaeraceae bacterium]
MHKRRATTICTLVLPALGFLTACTVGPDYEPPEVTIPESFRYAAEDVVDAEGEEVLWWRLFGDAQLEGYIDEALHQNQDLLIAIARVQEFESRLGISRSQRMPSVDFGATGGYQQVSGETGLVPIRGDDRRSEFYQLDLSARWELDVWGRISRSNEAAMADLLASVENRRAIVLSLITAVAESYITLLSLDEQLAIAKRSLKAREQSLTLFERQREEGVISRLEVSQLRSEYERTAATLPALQREIARLEHALSVLLGRVPGPIERVEGLDQVDLPRVPGGLPSDLLQRRPDVQLAEQQMISANAQIGVAVAEYYPRVSLTGLLGVASNELQNLPTGQAVLYQIAAGAAGPIFSGGRIRSGVELAEAVKEQAVQQYAQVVLFSLREVENALVTLETIEQESGAIGRQVDALRTYSELAGKRYDNGYVSFIEVLDAERDLFDSELREAQLDAQVFLSVIQLYSAFGGGWVDAADEMVVDSR